MEKGAAKSPNIENDREIKKYPARKGLIFEYHLLQILVNFF